MCSHANTPQVRRCHICHSNTTCLSSSCCCQPQDRTIRLWNPLKGLFIKEYRGHGYEVRDVSVSGDNSKMASVGGDRQVRTCGTAQFLWYAEHMCNSSWVHSQVAQLHCEAVSHSCSLSNRHVLTAPVEVGPLPLLLFVAVCLFVCWVCSQVFLWDVASGGVIRKFKGHDSRINAVSEC